MFENAKKIEKAPALMAGGIMGTLLGATALYSGGMLLGATTALSGGITASLVALWVGARKVPVGFRALPLWLGERLKDFCFTEGWKWYWPKPFGDLDFIDCRSKNLDIDVKEILSNDQIPVEVKVSLTWNVGPQDENPSDENWANALYRHLNVDGPVKVFSQEVEDQLRAIVSGIKADDIHSAKKEIAADLHYGKSDSSKPKGDGSDLADNAAGEGGEAFKNGIQNEVFALGINVTNVQITDIRLPKAIEEAKQKQMKEEAEKVAEKTEREGVIEAVEAYKGAGLSPQDAIIAHQVERGKAGRNVQTVQGIDLAGLGAAIAAGLKKGE